MEFQSVLFITGTQAGMNHAMLLQFEIFFALRRIFWGIFHQARNGQIHAERLLHSYFAAHTLQMSQMATKYA